MSDSDLAYLLRVGVEFTVMQERLRHSSLGSTLDVYTEAITPVKRAVQAPSCRLPS